MSDPEAAPLAESAPPESWATWGDNMPLEDQVELLGRILMKHYPHTFDRSEGAMEKAARLLWERHPTYDECDCQGSMEHAQKVGNPSVRECRQCGRHLMNANPWDCMVPGGKTYGPFCTRRCLDLWAKHFDGGRTHDRHGGAAHGHR